MKLTVTLEEKKTRSLLISEIYTPSVYSQLLDGLGVKALVDDGGLLGGGLGAHLVLLTAPCRDYH